MAKLVVRSGHDVGAEFILKGDRLVIGRRSQCAVPIADLKASREHALILEKNGCLFVQDTSRNGTLLNDKPATKAPEGSKLVFGDRIKIGDTVLELVDEKAEPISIDVPGYKIYEQIGSGGMGTVYKARQLSMDRIVALKVLNERYSNNAEFVDRFIREARAAGKLNHPNVIHVHDISRAVGRHYFSMEFVDGPSVKELLRKEKKLNLNKALDIVLQTAKALEFAHENRIVHRDIKPENIMLTKEGIVKIADLGIAKTFEEASPSTKEPRRVMGTPHYMAPEQALGKAIDHRADIYSLGATFYHTLTGVTPFTGNTAQEILKAHVQASLPAIQELSPGTPDPVCFIIERMMAKLPEKRYSNMSRLIEDIERVQSGAVKGIDRIAIGESSILRASGGGKPPAKPPAPPRTIPHEVTTGAQSAVSKAILPLALIIIFVAVVIATVLFLRQQEKLGSAGVPPAPGSAGVSPAVPGHGNSSPDAQKLLDAALASQAANDNSGYVEHLTQIKDRFPASSQAEEARKRLDDYVKTTRENERKAADALLTEARNFETANSSNTTGSIAKYKAAVAAAASFPSILDAAKTALDRLEKRLSEENAKARKAALDEAIDRAHGAKNHADFDAARKALNDFMESEKDAPLRDQAAAELAKVNAEAEAAYKGTVDTTTKQDLPDAVAEWNRYSAQVKDATKADAVKEALKQLDAKAEQLAQDDLAKAAEAAKKNNYAEALALTHSIQKKLATLRWADLAKAKEESLHKQKALYEKVLSDAGEKLAAGPVRIPFPLETRFGKVDWTLARIRGDQLNLDAIPVTAAPGLTKRLCELTPKEQYQFCLLFLPKDLTPDLHKALAAFCAEIGLSAEAEMHEQMAGKAGN